MNYTNKKIEQDCATSCYNIKSFENLQNATILVTGGTGFFGKWIAETISYLNRNYGFNSKLYLLARNTEKFKSELPHFANNKDIFFIDQDVRNLHQVPIEINYVINAAGTPDSREHVSQPLRTIETIYKGTANILDISFRLPNLVKIVHISSHQIYGNNTLNTAITEDYLGNSNSNSLNAAYSEGKRIAETLCAIYRNQQRLPIVTVRPFAFLGPYQSLDKPWAINNFVRDAILHQPIRILGNENTIRSYLYASDMASWLLNILCNANEGEVFNLGSGSPISLIDLAKKINNITNANVDIINKSSKDTYNKNSILFSDNVNIINKLQVKETINLEDALSNTISWNKKNYL